MPPKKAGGKLPVEVIADFEKWVAMGAPDPREGAAGRVTKGEADWEKAREWWAWKKPQATKVPTVRNPAWARTEVDRFLMAAMEARELQPAPHADRDTLVRRMYYDLVGLPPSPEEVNQCREDGTAEPRKRGAAARAADAHAGASCRLSGYESVAYKS